MVDYTYIPSSIRDVQAIVSDALIYGQPLEVIGGGTKREISNPARETARVVMTDMSEVIDYDPSELVITVQPGALLADIQKLLSEHNQMLAFDPFEFSDVTGQSTIGGMVASGFAGSRRISAGSVRDHVLGFQGVSGRGEVFIAGGKVVKNVTGYDLSKVMTGSWGQLAILTEITLKVLPWPLVSQSLTIKGLDAEVACHLINRAMASAVGLAAAAHDFSGDETQTVFRLEGFEASVEARLKALKCMLFEAGCIEQLSEVEAYQFWKSVRPNKPESRQKVLWRIIVPTTEGGRAAQIVSRLGGSGVVDWAGGLLWATIPETVSADCVRREFKLLSGHCMIMSASREYRSVSRIKETSSRAVAALEKRVKVAFDPKNILDPQRFTGGAL